MLAAVFSWSMNAEPPGSEVSNPAPQRLARRWLKLALISVGVLAVAVLAVRPWKAPPQQTFVWLNPSQVTKATSPGPFTRLKYKVMNLTAPLWQRFRRPRQQVLIQANFVELPPGLGEQARLGPPMATNSDGTLAWSLSPSDLTDFQKFLDGTPEARQLGRPRIQTISGFQAAVTMGSSAPGSGGLGMDVTATIVSPAIRLLVKVQSTERAEGAPGNAPSIKTNLALACRALLPNAGGLVLQAGKPKEPRATNCWLILSPTAIDARGKPIKL